MLPGNLDLYKSLFRGREDLFAIRWEKNGKATYFPSYDYDPYQFRLHKMKGETLQTFQNKTLSALTNDQVERHVNGEHFIGIYPLLIIGVLKKLKPTIDVGFSGVFVHCTDQLSNFYLIDDFTKVVDFIEEMNGLRQEWIK